MWRLKLSDLAGIDPDSVECFTHRERDHCVALQGGEMHGFTGRSIDRFKVALRAARQVHLQARVSEIKDPGAERVEAPPRHLRGEAALDQRREQMVTC